MKCNMGGKRKQDRLKVEWLDEISLDVNLLRIKNWREKARNKEMRERKTRSQSSKSISP